MIAVNGLTAAAMRKPSVHTNKPRTLLRKMIRYRFLYLLAAPTVIYFILFKYVPMWGILIAFQDYSPWLGFWNSEWIGFQQFIHFFGYDDFWILLRNTLGISLLNLILYFPAPIILALLLNEVGKEGFKRVVQSIVYLPHFLSWVVVVSFTYFFLSIDMGIVNKALVAFGYEPVSFMTNSHTFWLLLVMQSIWKEVGWGTIIYLAAISAVDVQLYEAAHVDGANRFRKLWHITLPGIKGTIAIMLILRLGNIMDIGFEHIFLMQNALVMPVADVFDTFVYRLGIVQGRFSYSTAVGLFQSVVGIILVVSANKISKMLGEESLY